MSTIAAPLSRLRAPAARFQALPVALRVALGVAFIAGFSLALRTQAIHARYWIDEGLSVGIASHPFFDIPGVLRQDGSPPLYYLLLHLWMTSSASARRDTHALSLGLRAAAVPVALHGPGAALFGPRAGWFAAGAGRDRPVPHLLRAGDADVRARRAAAAWSSRRRFALAFVQRRPRVAARRSPSSRRCCSTRTTGGCSSARHRRRRRSRCSAREPDRRARCCATALLGSAASRSLYLPWVPTLLFQAAHTGAPWSEAPRPTTPSAALDSLLGGPPSAMAFALGAGERLAGLLVAPRLRGPQARAALALLTMAIVALALRVGDLADLARVGDALPRRPASARCCSSARPACRARARSASSSSRSSPS